jgi:CBS-domain-containing membrane protein
MVATVKRTLLDVTAADLMSRELTLVPQDMSLPAAAHLLSRARISGAPVVDQDGRCVGVLSSTDFVHYVDTGDGHPGRRPAGAPERVCEWQVINVIGLPGETVRTFMTPDPVTAGPHTTISDLARMMLDAHIHRVVITDNECRPTGVVSSTDILAAVANAEPE